MTLPEEYRGVLVERRDEQVKVAEDSEPAEEDRVGAGILEVRAEFGDVVLWGHESIADASSDPYARSLEEWLQVADRVGATVSLAGCTTLTFSDTCLRWQSWGEKMTK